MDEFLTPSQVAARLGTSRKYVYDLMRTGQLTHVELGAHKRIARSVLDAFVAERTRAAQTA